MNNVTKIRKVSIAGKYAKLQVPSEFLKIMGYSIYVRITLDGKTLLVEPEVI